MPVGCVVGLQWGDEGKGKIVDLLASDADVIVRFQGGANAGHTVKVGGETFVLHLIPSGILHPGKQCVIANGVVLDPDVFLEEVDGLVARGIDVEGRLVIAERAHLALPHHRALDRGREHTATTKIGTTGRGIGPAYADKVNRVGIRVGEIRDIDRFAGRVRENTARANDVLTKLIGAEPLDVEETVEGVVAAARRLLPWIGDTVTLVQEAIESDRRVFLEGAQGIHLDVDFGTYPFVTSSSASVLGAGPGAGVPGRALDDVLGVAKAYSTRVGEGPFPTELLDATGERLREAGHEFGSTTGRPRRCGWFDAVATRWAIRLMGVDAVVLTKLDTLRGFERLRVATGYRVDGKPLTAFPFDRDGFESVEPVYEELDGFEDDVSTVRRRADLPKAARDYCDFLEGQLGVPLRMISVGKERNEVITS